MKDKHTERVLTYHRMCPFCGAWFYTQNYRKAYCDKEHYYLMQKKRYNAGTLPREVFQSKMNFE